MAPRARSGRRLGLRLRQWLFTAVLVVGAACGRVAGQSVDAGRTVLIRPGAEAGPTKVGVGIWVIDIDNIDSAAQSFVANVFIVLRWVDPRLAHDHAEGVAPYALTDVWAPRCLLANEIGLVRQTLPAIVEAEPAGYVFEFRAARSWLYYVLKVFIPLILIVMMSWTVFWIDPNSSGTQIGVATTAMLTLIAYRFAVDTLVPRVSYLTRLDKFILGATLLVFLSLVEVMTTDILMRTGRPNTADILDRYSRFVFPAAFVAVVCISFLP